MDFSLSFLPSLPGNFKAHSPCFDSEVSLGNCSLYTFVSIILLIFFQFVLIQIVPNAGIMFLSFEYSKRVCLFYNGYTESPFSDVPKLYVDQSMSPNELRHHHSKKKAHGK